MNNRIRYFVNVLSFSISLQFHYRIFTNTIILYEYISLNNLSFSFHSEKKKVHRRALSNFWDRK